MIAVVILNWNGAKMLRRFLPSVLSHSAGWGEIIVADNDSSDDSVSLLRNEFPEVRLLRLAENYGFAEGYNQAFRLLETECPKTYDYYLLLNSDVESTPQWLKPLREYMDTHPEVAAAQPKLLAEWDNTSFEYAGGAGGFIDRDGYPFCRGRLLNTLEQDKGQYEEIIPIFWASGAALLIRSQDWHSVGGLDGNFFAHNEEIDLCWRLNARGRKVVCIPQSVVYHVGGGTLPKDHPRKTYLNFRNNLLMLYKNLPATELHSVMLRRWWLDRVAALKFLLTLDFANSRAVMQARRDFLKLKKQYVAIRKENLQKSKIEKCSTRWSKSLLWAYYIKGKKCFSDLGLPTE